MSGEVLLPPAGMRGPGAIHLLAEAIAADRLTLQTKESGQTVRLYLDTFDGRLSSEALTAVHSRPHAGTPSGRLAVIDDRTGDERAGESLAVPDGPVLAVELAPGPLREALLPIVDVRALLIQAEITVETEAYAVCDNLGKTVARMTVEHPMTGTELASRIQLTGLRGYARETARVLGRARELGFVPARRRLLDDAILAVGGAPGGISSKVGVELVRSQRSDAAAVAILRRLVEVIQSNRDGALRDLDAEFLHDLRVAVRRTRSVQRELRAVFPPAELARFRAEFRWLQQATGPARDFDVYVLEFDAMRELVPDPIRGDLDPVLHVLRERRALAHRAMARDLRSERYIRLMREWETLLEGLVALPADDRPQAQRAIGELAGARIVKVYKRMLTMGKAIDGDSPADDYHEVRKQGKELRYLLELFGTPLFDADVVKPMVRVLKGLQDVLGRHQDRDVQQGTLRDVGAQVSMLPGRTAALMAMGVLLQSLHDDELAARGEFRESFAAFSAKELRDQVKRTFK